MKIYFYITESSPTYGPSDLGCFYRYVLSILFTPIFSIVHMNKWGQIIYIAAFFFPFLFSYNKEVACAPLPPAVMSCYFLWNTSTESTCC